jgi:hypothetical protein
MLSLPLVCGSDGLTYAGACLAHCQDVPVAHAGPCTDDRHNTSSLIDLEAIVHGMSGDGTLDFSRALQQVPAASAVAASTLNRFKKEGFKCDAWIPV